jgi:1,2-diacylglycerol 3-alpha-glucosyltransferase
MRPKERYVPDARHTSRCRAAVIWIDWYAYHVARFAGLEAAPSLSGKVVGIELVGGVGVHHGLKFREDLPEQFAIETLMPKASWHEASKFQLARTLWQRLSALDPDVVLVPGYYTLPAIAAALWAKLHGRISVLMTESTAYDHERVGWKEFLKSVILRTLFDWAVAGGKAHVTYLQQLRFPADRITGFYDVVDNDFFAQGTQSLRTRSATEFGLPSPYFLYVGRLSKEKNVDGLLTSWIEYRKDGGTWPLVLVGDGPEASALRQLALHSDFASDVIFAGLKSSHELLPFYAFAGCFVLPSTREPWGLVVNEAMASALPVLVSNRCGCAPDLVLENGNGVTFDPCDRVSITASLHAIERTDAQDRKRMGQRSAEIIQGFSPCRFGRSIAAIADSSREQRRMAPLPGGAQ